MVFIRNLKKSVCLLPALALIALCDVGSADALKFFGAALLMICGFVLFSAGIDSGIFQMGEIAGGELAERGRLIPILISVFVTVMVTTLGEPSVYALADAIGGARFLAVFIALGIACFAALAFFRILRGISFKTIALIVGVALAVAFGVALLRGSALSMAAFGAVASMSLINAPFIIAAAFGIAQARQDSHDEDSFGTAAMAACGGVAAVLVYSAFAGGKSFWFEPFPIEFVENLPAMLARLGISIGAALLAFLLMQVFFIKLSKKNFIKLLVGAAVAFLGLAMFLGGAEYGLPFIAKNLVATAVKNNFLLVVVTVVACAACVFAEPLVSIVCAFADKVTHNSIKKSELRFSVTAAAVLAAVFVAVSIITKINPYIFALLCAIAVAVLAVFCPKDYCALAFDCGIAAAGNLTVMLILPFVGFVSAAVGLEPLSYAFASVVMLAALPTLAVEILGLIKGSHHKGDADDGLVEPVEIDEEEIAEFIRAAKEDIVVDGAVGEMKIIAIIIPPDDERALIARLKQLGAKGATAVLGKGAANVGILWQLGLESNEKSVVIAYAKGESAAEILKTVEKEFLSGRGRGLGFSISASRFGGANMAFDEVGEKLKL